MDPYIKIGILGVLIIISAIIYLIFLANINFLGASGWLGYLLIAIGSLLVVISIKLFYSEK